MLVAAAAFAATARAEKMRYGEVTVSVPDGFHDHPVIRRSRAGMLWAWSGYIGRAAYCHMTVEERAAPPATATTNLDEAEKIANEPLIAASAAQNRDQDAALARPELGRRRGIRRR